MSANDAWAHTPRQYRPHAYIPSHLPKSTSLSSIDCGSSYHVAPQSSRRAIPTATSYNRRRTDTTFPGPTTLHSTATVARSRLTASVSGNDISQPSPRFQKHRLSEVQNIAPSRIPTPVLRKSSTQIRYASTPVLPSQTKQKENMQPQTLRLLGPISPTRNQSHPHIPRSRTMGMLSSLTSSFSRSSLNMSGSRQSSTSSATLSIPSTTSNLSPLPVFSTNIRQIHTAQSNFYWCGRFLALDDRLHNEVLEQSLSDTDIMRQYMNGPPSPKVVTITRQPKAKGKTKPEDIPTQYEQIEDTCSAFISKDRETRIKRVFNQLEVLCMTTEAKRSLWEWQLAYARQQRNESFLPNGGKMVDKAGWVSRMGRAIIGSGSSDASGGRRTELSLGGYRKLVIE